MPYFKSSQDWLAQSLLLLEARPDTTRVTTKYSLKPLKPRRSPSANADTDAAAAAATPKPPRGHLVLKTYDPVSGVALKYRTSKAAEVSRLVQATLGRIGKSMAGVPYVPEVEMTEVAAEAGAATPTTATNAAEKAQGQHGAGGGGAGGKKKKKGKK